MPATCPYPGPARSSPTPHPTSRRSILIISSYLCLGLPRGLFSSGFPTRPCTHLSSLPMRATCFVHLILLDFITPPLLSEEYRSLSSSLCSFLHSRYLVTLRPKYPSHCPILYPPPRPSFLSQCERPSFTPIQYNRRNYSSVHLNL